MKKIIAVLALAAFCFAGYSQDASSNTNTVPAPPTTPSLGFFDSINWSSTNWVFVPFVAYIPDSKDIGGGAAVLYEVSPNFWTGYRYQKIGDMEVWASVQGQLQVSKTMFGMTFTPFVEAAAGLGEDATYANAGAGMLVNFHTWTIGTDKTLSLGAGGDYEHFVMGSRSGDQVNAFALVRYSF